MSLQQTLVIHYDEIALKGRNRGMFERQLIDTLREACAELGHVEVRKLYGRFLLRPADGSTDLAPYIHRIQPIPGIAYVLEAIETAAEMPTVRDAVTSVIPEQSGAASFGVRVKRADKNFPMRSLELERELGAHVLDQRSWQVDLKEPDVWVRVEIVNGRALVATKRHDGFGGLPVGASGRGVVLLSGGIDSPVAAWMMMNRGLRLSAVHFHSAPYTNQRSQEKVRDLAKLLLRFQPQLQLTMFPFAEPIQQTIVKEAPQRYRVILYRRFMMRLAERAARAKRASCLVTGEALGQVASQTIENMATVEAVAGLPILRPLVGTSKAQIIETARRIGTFETSIEPHDDCCSYLMPRSPATRSTPEELADVEKVFDIDGLVDTTWDNREVEIIGRRRAEGTTTRTEAVDRD